MKTHLGIDYGSKKAGTTAICYLLKDKLYVEISEKNKDADKFTASIIGKIKPELVFIDAPLTLPGAYYKKGTNYHFRKCDVELKAMSPMFLGGLTARAIQLSNEFKTVEFYETYPKHLVKIFEISEFYKKYLDKFIASLQVYLKLKIISELKTWHHVDAVLAWFSGYRFINKLANFYGDKNEGVIIV